ncbi:phytanoyl-CoA dioxygenase family protein [Azospirillum sp. RWY-5-1]|uniref:Phytanoyl-CoA dioxygenase family protein n=1 Tax=Azospirillum oleiclasticum TaxID=2735135 RepID=A0ABX2T980_9PROT|nr:phytanoyl-CoA dioxygenase family protein [Azospirillum oleiclasticum]NYZ12662.1 phytanoyl-CoA dioxygenase family protein [Azospirillum oleiclasticum]NYZ19822.1 phytanoyl-CoA dioxygenase family protein [Azospirillum oleiclasticum]
MGKLLTDEQIAGFHANGFVTRIPVLTPAEVAELVARTEAFEAERPQDVSWAFDIKCNLLLDWVYELGRHERLLDAVEDLIGPDILMTNGVYRNKNPGSAVDYGWHQDSARIQVDPTFVICYVALSPATSENGCLRAIPGTQDRVRPFSLTEGPGQRKRLVARVIDVDESQAVDLVLEPGEAAIFHSNLVHGSAPNLSQSRRMALLYDYTPAAARQNVGRGSGQLVRGVDHWNHFGHEPVPEPGLTEGNVLRRREILGTYHENVLMGPRLPGETVTFPDRPY